MDDFINRVVDKTGDFVAARPGLLPLIAVVLVIINFILQIFPGAGYWIVDSNFFLHLGLIIGFLGLLLIRPLG